MKQFMKLMPVVFLFIFVCASARAFAANPAIPDVMNKILVYEQDGSGFRSGTFDADSFPAYSGYPKIVQGQSFEGGIACQMDSDSELELVYGIANSIQAWNLDGSNVTGWPISLSFNAQGAPAYGDIDGDGQAEIVLGTSNFFGNAGAVYAFEKNGTPVAGFPVNLGATTRTIVLADLNNDGALEIITNKRMSQGEVWVYKGDGTAYPGWPKTLNHVPASSSAAGDITGDGIPEIIAQSYLSIYAWDRNGNALPGFPYSMPNGDVNSYSSPVLADVDGDNIREIIFGTHVTGSGGGGFVYILKNNGTVLPNWPKNTAWWVYGPPAVGFINDDNIIDIAAGDQIGSGIPTNWLYAWDKNGNALPNFPVGPLNAINNQITLADLDNDSRLELLIDDNTQTGGMGKYLCFNHDGSQNNEWTIPLTGASFFNMPALADLNSDGRLDLAGAGFTAGGSNQTYVYIWNTNRQYNAARTVNPVWQFNVRHNGVYGDNSLVSVAGSNEPVPAGYVLRQNYPNPFNPVTKIEFSLPAPAYAEILVFDLLGKTVAQPVSSFLQSGTHGFSFDASSLPGGVYFCSLIADGTRKDVKTLVLIK